MKPLILDEFWIKQINRNGRECNLFGILLTLQLGTFMTIKKTSSSLSELMIHMQNIILEQNIFLDKADLLFIRVHANTHIIATYTLQVYLCT